MNKPNETLETSTLKKNFCICVNANLTDLLMNTHFKKRPPIVMICVTINIYVGAPVRS